MTFRELARMRRTAMCQAAGRTLDIESEVGEELMEFTRHELAAPLRIPSRAPLVSA